MYALADASIRSDDYRVRETAGEKGPNNRNDEPMALVMQNRASQVKKLRSRVCGDDKNNTK